MTRDDFIGQLEGYLDEYEGATPLPGAVRNVIRAQLPSTTQIGPVAGLMRDLNMSMKMSEPVRYGLVAAVAVAAVVVGAALLSVGPFVGEGHDTPTPAPSPMLIEPTGGTNPLAAGRYYIDDPFPVRISFELSVEGWMAAGYADAASFDLGKAGNSGQVSLEVVDNLFADPCNPAGGQLDPPVGPSVDDLVTALANLRGIAAADAEAVTVDGYDGKRIVLRGPLVGGACDQATLWSRSTEDIRVGGGETFDLQILDVNGVRLVIATVYTSSTITEGALSELLAIVDSIEIQ